MNTRPQPFQQGQSDHKQTTLNSLRPTPEMEEVWQQRMVAALEEIVTDTKRQYVVRNQAYRNLSRLGKSDLSPPLPTRQDIARRLQRGTSPAILIISIMLSLPFYIWLFKGFENLSSQILPLVAFSVFIVGILSLVGMMNSNNVIFMLIGFLAAFILFFPIIGFYLLFSYFRSIYNRRKTVSLHTKTDPQNE
jgi:hypothetical protein